MTNVKLYVKLGDYIQSLRVKRSILGTVISVQGDEGLPVVLKLSSELNLMEGHLRKISFRVKDTADIPVSLRWQSSDFILGESLVSTYDECWHYVNELNNLNKYHVEVDYLLATVIMGSSHVDNQLLKSFRPGVTEIILDV